MKNAIKLCDKNKDLHKLTAVALKRIRRAGEKIKQENSKADIDIGFKVFRVADTNIKWNLLMDAGQLDLEQIESTPDLMDFMPNANTARIYFLLFCASRGLG